MPFALFVSYEVERFILLFPLLVLKTGDTDCDSKWLTALFVSKTFEVMYAFWLRFVWLDLGGWGEGSVGNYTAVRCCH